MQIQFEVVAAYILGLVLLYIVGWLLLVPMKWILRLLYNGLAGGVLLFLFNLVGGIFGAAISINVVTALVAGFLGIPGVLMLWVLQYILR